MKLVSDALKVKIPVGLKPLYEEQIEFLHKISGVKSERHRDLDTYQELFLAKLSYAKLIKSHHIQSCLATESINPHIVEMSCKGKLKFNYQRVDSQVLDYDLSPFYSLDQNLNIANFFWTSTCQGAISSIFLAMHRHSDVTDLVLPFGAYWESLGFFTLLEFAIKAAPETSGFVLYLDSSTAPSGWFNKIEPFLQGASWIVVDTTCWDLDAADFSFFLNYVKEKNIGPIMLVRSHQKLDCLGLEYGRLGSVLILDQRRVISDKFILTLKDIFSWQGIYAHTEQMYPFFADKGFPALSRKWLEAVRNSNQSLLSHPLPSLMRNRAIEIEDFSHKKFFWVRFKGSLSEDNVQLISRKLSIILRALDLPHLSIASYPWDFISITFFRQRHSFSTDQNGQQVLRLSLPPLTDKQLEGFRQGFQFWLNWIGKNYNFERELV
jgi:hypothetical protein